MSSSSLNDDHNATPFKQGRHTSKTFTKAKTSPFNSSYSPVKSKTAKQTTFILTNNNSSRNKRQQEHLVLNIKPFTLDEQTLISEKTISLTQRTRITHSSSRTMNKNISLTPFQTLRLKIRKAKQCLKSNVRKEEDKNFNIPTVVNYYSHNHNNNINKHFQYLSTTNIYHKHKKHLNASRNNKTRNMLLKSSLLFNNTMLPSKIKHKQIKTSVPAMKTISGFNPKLNINRVIKIRSLTNII